MSQNMDMNNGEGMQQEPECWVDYYPMLQRYCRFLAQNAWDGDDIAQETYMKALRYQEHQLSSALLKRIAYHHWIDQVRKRKKESLETDVDLSSHPITHQLDEIRNAVDLLLCNFTPKQAVIFMLKEAFQYQIKEIADILNTSEMAVKASLHRAKKRLEKDESQSAAMEPFWNEEERQQLADSFYQALKDQDPAVLIQSIPVPESKGKVPRSSANNTNKNDLTSPLSTFCMAA